MPSSARSPKPAKTLDLAEAEKACVTALGARDYASAIRAVAEYEARQPVARGINVNWNRPDLNQVAGLRSIFESQEVPAVQMAAALMYLWGCSRPYRRWLSREANGDAAAGILVRGAYRAQQERAWARAREVGFI